MTPQDLAGVLAEMKERHAEVEKELSDPKIYSDRLLCRKLSRERGRLEEFFLLYDDWSRALHEASENHEMLQTEQDEGIKANDHASKQECVDTLQDH